MSVIESSKTSNVNEYDEGLTPDTIQKYKTAAEIVNDAMKTVIGSIAVGSKIVTSCQLGDDTIAEKAKKVYSKGNLEKGIAFPTCISVNHCVGHFSPLAESEDVFKEGDLIKIDLAAHIDGYIAMSAQTFVLKANQEPITGPAANVVAAAYYASEIAYQLLKVGGNNQEVTEAIQKVAEFFHCKPVEGVLSHQMSRFVLDQNKVIINKIDVDHNVDLIRFEQGEVYCIDIVMSTADGKTREEEKTTVYKKNTNSYSLKLKSSRAVFGEITRRFPTLPFCVRQLEDQKSRLGIVECVKHELLDSYPVLFERDGGLVAQFKFTALLTPNGVQRITSNSMNPNNLNTFTPDYNILSAEALTQSPFILLKSTSLYNPSSSSSASASSSAPSSSKSKSKKKKKNAGQQSKEGAEAEAGEAGEEGKEEDNNEKGKEPEQANQ